MGGFGNSFGGGGGGGWPYNVNPAQYIQQAFSQQPMPGTTAPSFRSQWYQPPNQQSPLRDQLVSLFGNALMSQQAFPQIIQSLMQNPAAARGQLGLLSPPQSYSPDKDFWRINWNNPPTGASANTSAASGGNNVWGTQQVPYGSTNGSFMDSGSANGATGAAGAGSTGAGVGEGGNVSGGEAGTVGASVGGNAGTAAGASDAGGGASTSGDADSGVW